MKLKLGTWQECYVSVYNSMQEPMLRFYVQQYTEHGSAVKDWLPSQGTWV